jgi:AraC-like DNA-binding protein
MKLYIKYDINLACRVLLKEQLEALDVKYEMLEFGEIEINDAVSDEKFSQLQNNLSRYGIEIVNNQKSQLVQKIKDTIIDMIYEKDKLPTSTISNYLADQLHLSYGYIANIFSEHTYTSIENFIIIQKIERAKKLIIEDGLTLTEVSYQLNYSSVAYLSAQFKKVTGLTPSSFKRIVDKRRELLQVK